MENVLKAPAAMQQAKAYLYGSLLYYLTMTKQEDSGVQRSKGKHVGCGRVGYGSTIERAVRGLV